MQPTFLSILCTPVTNKTITLHSTLGYNTFQAPCCNCQQTPAVALPTVPSVPFLIWYLGSDGMLDPTDTSYRGCPECCCVWMGGEKMVEFTEDTALESHSSLTSLLTAPERLTSSLLWRDIKRRSDQLVLGKVPPLQWRLVGGVIAGRVIVMAGME